MWRRNNNGAEPQADYQVYNDSSPDERYLETIHEVESLYSRRSSVAATALPELPLFVELPLALNRPTNPSLQSRGPSIV